MSTLQHVWCSGVTDSLRAGGADLTAQDDLKPTSSRESRPHAAACGPPARHNREEPRSPERPSDAAPAAVTAAAVAAG